MVNASLISRLSHAVDEIEKRSQQNRPWKVVTVRRSLEEDGMQREIATSPPIPRIVARISCSSSFTMKRNWPTRAKITHRLGRLARNPKSASVLTLVAQAATKIRTSLHMQACALLVVVSRPGGLDDCSSQA